MLTMSRYDIQSHHLYNKCLNAISVCTKTRKASWGNVSATRADQIGVETEHMSQFLI